MNWGEINDEIGVFMDDQSAGTYITPLRMSAFNRAQQYFAVTHTAPIKTIPLVLTPLNGGMVADLPADFMSLLGLASGGSWMPRYEIVSGNTLSDSGFLQLSDSKIWFPSATMQAPTLWYYAFYRDMQDDTTVCELPKWAEWAVIHLAIAYILTPNMISMADIRRWQTRREAGQPEDNSGRQQAMYHLAQYTNQVASFRPQDRNALFTR